MNLKPGSFKRALALAGIPVVALAIVLLISGCKKEQPAAQQPAPQTTQAGESASHEHAAMSQGTAQQQSQSMPMHEQASAEQPAAQTVATEQKTCPVMEGNPINKNIFVEYKGKKVYFCCKSCPEQFLANPEKYVANLPQFQQ